MPYYILFEHNANMERRRWKAMVGPTENTNDREWRLLLFAQYHELSILNNALFTETKQKHISGLVEGLAT